MRMRSTRRYVSSTLLVAVVVVSILSLSRVQASLFTEWAVPTSGSVPNGIFVDGGLVYFTEFNANRERSVTRHCQVR
jgi:hypothetical protein